MPSFRTASSPLRRSLVTGGFGVKLPQNASPTRSLFTFAQNGSGFPQQQQGSKKGFVPGGYKAALAFSLPFSFGFATKAAAPNADVESKSSTVIREKSPAAFRPQATTLMFASVKGDMRYDWQDWIAYFREAGFDCIDANLDYAEKSTSGQEQAHDILADELGSQVRLSVLQRSPLLFAHLKSSVTPGVVSILHSHLHSRPQVSGVILVAKDNNTSEEDKRKLDEMSKKLGGRLLIVNDDEAGLRDSERWLIEKGF